MKQLFMAIAKEAASGLAIGLREFLKHSLLITTLILIVMGQSWMLIVIDERHKINVREIKAEVLELKKEHAAQITELRHDITECNQAREAQAIQIIELRYLLGKMKR